MGLALAVMELPEPARRLAWLAEQLPSMPGSGIVYCLTVRDAEQVAAWLRTREVNARAYTGEADSADRVSIEQELISNDVKVVVATSALGMGFDKPDLTFVIHYQSPGSPIAYYQQVGRAGRALEASMGALLAFLARSRRRPGQRTSPPRPRPGRSPVGSPWGWVLA